jgi:hypothetical protein
MSAQTRAEERFLVRFGELTFGEQILETMASVGFDAFGFSDMGVSGPLGVTAVVEIIDRQDGRIVWRARDEAEAVRAHYDLIARELHTVDAATFAAEWDLR